MIDPVMWICLGLFVVLMFIEMPIPFCMLLSSMVFAVIHGQSFVMFAQKTIESFADFTLLAVPAFLFVGILMNEMGMTKRLFTFAEKWIGHFPGGLAHANVLASMVFAGMSGSALADAGGLGTIEVKAMKEAGYDEHFSVAVTAASSLIGPIIPPSINLVIWGFLAETSTLALFMGGLVPGIIMGLAMMIWIVIAVKYLHVKAPVYQKASWRERFRTTLSALPSLFGPIILIGGILSGVFTPTECGVVAGLYCLIVAVFYRQLNLKMIIRTLKSTLSTTAMVMGLCATGLIFNWMVTTSGLFSVLANALMMIGSKYLVLLLLCAVLFVMGLFIGSMQILIMVAPLMINLCTAMDISMVHMGVIGVFTMTVGLITPPFAPSLFVTCKATGVSFSGSVKYTIQFLIPLIATLLLIIFIPAVVLWLPTLLGAL